MSLLISFIQICSCYEVCSDFSLNFVGFLIYMDVSESYGIFFILSFIASMSTSWNLASDSHVHSLKKIDAILIAQVFCRFAIIAFFWRLLSYVEFQNSYKNDLCLRAQNDLLFLCMHVNFRY